MRLAELIRAGAGGTVSAGLVRALPFIKARPSRTRRDIVEFSEIFATEIENAVERVSVLLRP